MSASEPGGDPQFVAVRRDDPEIRAAHARCAATIGTFVANVAAGLGHAMARLRFRDPDASEALGQDQFFYLWLRDVAFHRDERLLSGVFFEVPAGFEKWHAVGSRLGFEPEDVFDWMILEDGRLHGGFTIRVQRSRLPEARRAAFDANLGVDAYVPLDPP